MTLPPSLDAQHDAILKQLQDATAPDFDVNFMQQQIVTNESALRVQKSYAKSGRDASLRGFTSQTIPKIEMHLALADGSSCNSARKPRARAADNASGHSAILVHHRGRALF
jgi:predicted outer membrane protein